MSFKMILRIPLSLCFTIGFSLLFAGCVQSVPEKSESELMSHQIDSLVNLYYEYDGFNGSVLVAHQGEVIYKNGFGFANMEWEIPNQPDTKFRIASVTKPFTAMLIMQLVAEGKLDLRKPISTYLPDYPKENGDQITLHHLLTHSSGTPNEYESDDKLNRFPDKHRPEQLVNQFSGLPLEFSPGDRFSYSNAGYTVLGYIIETVSGKSYETMLQEKILMPLGMKNTGIDRHRPVIKNRAKGYFESYGEHYNANYIDMSTVYSSGYVYSTVEDMFLWEQALNSEKILPKKYMDLLSTKHIPDPGYGGHYGYGWEILPKPVGNTSNRVETIGHSGAIDGFCALITRIPSTNSSIIFLNNTRRAYLNSMTTAITGILNDTTYDFPKKPTAKFMTRVIHEEGIDKGIQFYKEHQDLPDYYIDEIELIVAGYKLLHAGNAEDAVKVFKLSTEIYPDRDNPYDSYAEALMALGRDEEAIANYKKSLELNPQNYNALEMLKKLEE